MISNNYLVKTDHITKILQQKIDDEIPIEIRKNVLSLKSGHDINIHLITRKNFMKQSNQLLFISNDQNELFKKYKPFLDKKKEKITLHENRVLKKKEEVYKILEYTKIGGATKFCNMGFAGKPALNGAPEFDYLNTCLYKNCIFTCDKSELNDADALLMHLTDVYTELIKIPTALNDLMQKRRPEQPWILWNDEANFVENNFDSLKFNWTLSYKIESEASYGTYGFYAPDNEKIKGFENFVEENFNRRSPNSIWFVSNCASEFRNHFTLDLGLNTGVTIFHGTLFLV